jgi:hypothetical protein
MLGSFLSSPPQILTFVIVSTAGWQIEGHEQILLRRSGRKPAERRFWRPDTGPASAWRDDPTTTKEEESKSAKIPLGIMVQGTEYSLAVPSIMMGSTTISASTAATLRVVKPRGRTPVIKFDQLPLSEAFKSVPVDDAEDEDDDKTWEMDTVDKIQKELEFEPWEMRK